MGTQYESGRTYHVKRQPSVTILLPIPTYNSTKFCFFRTSGRARSQPVKDRNIIPDSFVLMHQLCV